MYTLTLIYIIIRDERHARLQKKARPHENEDDDELQDEEEDLNESNFDEVRVEIKHLANKIDYYYY